MHRVHVHKQRQVVDLDVIEGQLQEEALQGGHVRVQGAQRLGLAPGVAAHRPVPAQPRETVTLASKKLPLSHVLWVLS